MTDTHINAYYGNVEEKKEAVRLAQADLDAAQVLLKNKLAETAPEDTSKPSGETPAPTEEPPDPAPGKGVFFKKK